MKRIRPNTGYAGDAGYPSVVDCAMSRRGFLRGAVARLGLAGGAVVLESASAAAGKGWLRVELPLDVRLKGCGNRIVERLIVQTRSRRLHAFLRHKDEQRLVRQALVALLARHSCADTQDRKRLARLEAALARVIVVRYRARRRRRVALPVATLILARRRRMPTPGFSAAVPAPVPRP